MRSVSENTSDEIQFNFYLSDDDDDDAKTSDSLNFTP
jgi:hypothetical protein